MDDDAGRVQKAFKTRLNIYRTKRDGADPLADENFNRYDALNYVIDAIELLALEAGLGDFSDSDALPPPIPAVKRR